MIEALKSLWTRFTCIVFTVKFFKSLLALSILSIIASVVITLSTCIAFSIPTLYSFYTVSIHLVIAVLYVLLAMSLHSVLALPSTSGSRNIRLDHTYSIIVYGLLILSIHYCIRFLYCVFSVESIYLASILLLVVSLTILLYPFIKIAGFREDLIAGVYKLGYQVVKLIIILLSTSSFLVIVDALSLYRLVAFDAPLIILLVYITRLVARAYWIEHIEPSILLGFRESWWTKLVEVPGLSISAKTPKLIHVSTLDVNTKSIAEAIIKQMAGLEIDVVYFLVEEEAIKVDVKRLFEENRGFIVVYSPKTFSPTTTTIDGVKVVFINNRLSHVDYCISLVNKYLGRSNSRLFIVRDKVLVDMFKTSEDMYFWLRHLMSRLNPGDTVIMVCSRSNRELDAIVEQLASLKIEM